MRIISFVSNRMHGGAGQPQPMKKFLPEWYRNAEAQFQSPKYDNKKMAGLKKCIPYLDAMISGYALVIPEDLHVSRHEDGSLKVEWESEKISQFIDERPKEMGATMPRIPGYLPNHLVFSGMWGWKTPRGYSTLVTPPLNRDDLPFKIMAGIMDTDEFWGAGNIPFYIREDFEGVIPKGTPFAQIIPIKRTSWKMTKNNQGYADTLEAHANIVRDPERSYKKTMWHRKEYN
jgi:hypothetical protein